MHIIRSLKFEEKPAYDEMLALLKEVFTSENSGSDFQFDWVV
jgi:hypothetical protein